MADPATDQTITYNAIPTKIGLTKIQLAMTTGVDLILATLAYGDGGGTTPTPDPEQTSLIHQLGSTDILGHEEDLEDNVTWYSGIIELDPNIHGTIREIGLFDDEGNLCFVGNVPDIVLPTPAEGVAITYPIQLGVKNYYSKYITIKTHIKVVEQIEGSGGYSLFDIVQKDHVLDYEESMGFGLQGTYVYPTSLGQIRYGYPDFIQKCLDEKNDPNTVVRRIRLGDETITGYVSPQGHIFYDAGSDKEAVDNYFDQTGIAWFYGIDENYEGDEDRVFLPRNNYFFRNSMTDPGKYNNASLPSLAHSHSVTVENAGGHTHTVTIGTAGSHSHTLEIYPAGEHRHNFIGRYVNGGFPASENLYKNFNPDTDAYGYGPFHKERSNVVSGESQNSKFDNDFWGFSYVPQGTISLEENHTHDYSMGIAGSHIHDITLATNGSHTHVSTADLTEIVGNEMLGDTVAPPSTNMLLYIVVGNVRRRPAMVIDQLVEEALETIEEAKEAAEQEIGETKEAAEQEINDTSSAAIEEVNSAVEQAEQTIQEKVDEAQGFAEEAERQAEISEYWAGVSIAGQIQADWDQTDTSSPDYIKNKPNIDWTDLVYLDAPQTLTNKTIDADSNTILHIGTSNFSQGEIITVLGDESVSQNTLATSEAIWYAIKDINILFSNLDPSLILTALNNDNVTQSTLATSRAIWDAIYNLPVANMGVVEDIRYIGGVSNSSLPTSLAVYTAIQEAASKGVNISAREGIIVDTNKRTIVEVSSSDEDLVVSSSYTGTQPEIGTLAYLFTYKEATTKLQTVTNVTSSNQNLTVTSYYTGTKPSVGTETHTLTFVDNQYGTYWSENGEEVDLVTYNLVVSGTPVEGDTITLVYTTSSVNVPAHWEDDNGNTIILANYDLSITSGTPVEGDVVTLVYTTSNNVIISIDKNIIPQLISYKNLKGAPNYVFQKGLKSYEGLQTLTVVECTNSNLTVTSSYTGTQPSVGTLTYTFSYLEDENQNLVWQDSSGNEVVLANYDLSITSGTPVEGDVITLVYETKNTTSVETDIQFSSGLDVQNGLSTRTDIDVSNPDLIVTSSYTGTKPSVGTETHLLTYTLEQQILHTDVTVDSTPGLTVTSTFTGNKPSAGTIIQNFLYTRETSYHTAVTVNCTNPDLTVTSSYTGTKSSVGIEMYSFTYRSYTWSGGVYFSWFLDDEVKVDIRDFDLSVTGEPEVGDVITLIYTTTESEDYLGWVLLKPQGETEQVNLNDYDLSITSGTPSPSDTITVTYVTTDLGLYDWENENSQIVTLQDYDLSLVSGTPVEGDTILLAYITTLGKMTVSVEENNVAQCYQPVTTFSNGAIVLEDDTPIYSSSTNITQNTTFTFSTSNLTKLANNYYTFEVQFTMPSVVTLTFPSNVYWQSGETPDFDEPGIYFLVFRTTNQGTTFLGNVQGFWEIPTP